MRFGLDVGGTKTEAVAVASGGRIIAQTRHGSGRGEDAVVAAILQAVARLAERAGVAPAEAESIGIGIPGQIEPGTTRATHAVNLGVAELDLAAALGPRFGVPVHVENDVKAAALGVAALRRAAAGGGERTIAYLNLGTGVAAGIVRDGLLWRGARGVAGEIGHLSIDPAGDPCPCGQRGCIETLVGGAALAQRWGRPAVFPVREAFDAADVGDLRAVALCDDLARGVAAAVRVLALTVDADVVVLGGGLTALGDRLLGRVQSRLRAESAASAFLRSLRLDERVELLPPGSPAAALGAALLGGHPTGAECAAHG